MENIITVFLSSLGSAGLVFYVVMKYYNNVRNCLNDIVSFLASALGWFKSSATKLSIETNGASSVQRLNQMVPELNLPELEIKWVKPDEHGNVHLEPGKAIVLLKYDRDNTQNIINTTAIYVQKTLLLNCKPFLDKGIRTAIDFAVIRAFLSKTPQKNYIVTQYVDICNEDIDRYGDAFGKVTKVEDEGLFTRVLLREYAVWGNKLVGKTRCEQLINESKNFLDFIYNIASRDFDEFTPLVFNEPTLKVAILLVAKYETFSEKGITPYLRRIREGFANGINTFYLLARNDKIEILKEVYGELMASGNYNLLNGPEVYKDNVGRNNICYCIEVKSDAAIAKDYAKIKDYIQTEHTLECSVTGVYRDNLFADFNSLPVIIPRNEITTSEDLRLKCYYSTGMTIEVIPLNVVEDGKIIASVLKTKSNPQNLFDNNFSVNSMVRAVVQDAEDNFLRLLVKDTDQKCIAYRRDLTYSRFKFLHKLFPVGSECEFQIKDIDYIHNCLELRLAQIPDPWSNVEIHEGEELVITVFNKSERCIETEIGEGIYAILPNSELSWFEAEIEKKKMEIKKNQEINVRIKKINIQHKSVILTCKAPISPYNDFYNNLPDNKYVKIQIESQNTYGIVGISTLKYKVFIPQSETFIGKNKYKINPKKECMAKIIKIDERGNSLIGTFKPFIKKPLQRFYDKFAEGQVMSHLTAIRVTNGGVLFKIKFDKNRYEEALLLNSEISDNCYISNLEKLFSNSFTCPMVLQKIDLDNNIILLSLKELTKRNFDRLQNLDYGTVYEGKVLGKNNDKYCVLLKNVWAEIIVESKGAYLIGDDIGVMKSSSTSFIDEKDV